MFYVPSFLLSFLFPSESDHKKIGFSFSRNDQTSTVLAVLRGPDFTTISDGSDMTREISYAFILIVAPTDLIPGYYLVSDSSLN